MSTFNSFLHTLKENIFSCQIFSFILFFFKKIKLNLTTSDTIEYFLWGCSFKFSKTFLKSYYFFIFQCMGVLPVCVSVYHVYSGVYGGQKRELDPLELK